MPRNLGSNLKVLFDARHLPTTSFHLPSIQSSITWQILSAFRLIYR